MSKKNKTHKSHKHGSGYNHNKNSSHIADGDSEDNQSNSHAKSKNYWMYATVVLIIILGISVFSSGGLFNSGSNSNSESNLNSGGANAPLDSVATKAVSVINNNLLSGGVLAKLVSKSEEDGLYKLELLIDGQPVEVYTDKSGEYLFTGAISLNAPPAPQKTQTPPSQFVDVSVDDDAVKGDPNAPITIIEFSDFECSFCAKFYSQTLPLIEEKYIDTGIVKLVYRDLPLGFHSQAQKAAEAAECAGDQGQYWEMHDKLFDNGVSGGVSSFKKYASELGLDQGLFDECLDTSKFADEVKADMADGSAAGVSGTPAFFVNGQKLVGAQPFEAFEQVIEAELAKLA
ncbi:thioredoxin domain-containing protein [Candidatus Woesearchaeota archaeon]|jgi:protein-disulfide isomerase|nr:thioredoxin domain-containing protein [Candidatus Woesearchaeota archaeon]